MITDAVEAVNVALNKPAWYSNYRKIAYRGVDGSQTSFTDTGNRTWPYWAVDFEAYVILASVKIHGYTDTGKLSRTSLK